MSRPRSLDLPSRFLLGSPALLIAVGGLRALGVPSAFAYLALALAVAGIGSAAWRSVEPALRSGEFARRAAGAACLLFALVLCAIGLFATLGPPQFSTPAENQLRYPLILSASLAFAAACLLLERALAAAGERLQSALGLAATLLAAPLYAVFAAMQLVEYRVLAESGAGEMSPELRLFDMVSLVLLLFGVLLNYLAAAAFTRAFVAVGWLGRRAGRALTTVAVIAAVAVAARMVEALASPASPLWGFERVWTAPGFVLAVPAVPWLMPCLLGVLAVGRACGAEAR